MNRFSRIWILALGIAVAVLIAAAAFVSQGSPSSSYSGTEGAPKSTLTPNPSSLLKKSIEKISLRYPAR